VQILSDPVDWMFASYLLSFQYCDNILLCAGFNAQIIIVLAV
jgi:hypothetical protein